MKTTPSCYRAGRPGLKKSQSLSLITFALLAWAGNLSAQSTNIAIGSTVLQPSVKRLGINLGTLTFYDSGQTTQNLMTGNPGFEGQIWNSTIRCVSGTATSCVDEDQYTGWTGGFWSGATFEVFYGASAGRTGTVTSSTAPGGNQGITLNFNNSGTPVANGDYLIVRKYVPGGASGGWWPSTTGNGVISDNFSDLPPGTLGKQTIALKAPTASDTASVAGFFDSTIGKTFVQLNGTYQLQFKAKGTGGTNKVNILVSRTGFTNYISQPLTLTNSWNTYTLPFTASENGSAIGIGGATFTTVGVDSFELDDVSLTKTNNDVTNTTIFRDPVVNALRTLRPGVLRYWGGQLGDTLDNLITPSFGRQRSGYLAWYTETDQIDYGLHDFLALCQVVGAEPWFVVPSTFSVTDASNLIEYLAGSSLTNYGSKRTALGQAVPWSQVFSKIHLEFGNEAWNGTFKGGSIEYAAPYSSRAQTIFGMMRSNPSYVASSFDLVLGGQAANPGGAAAIQNGCNNNDSFSVAPYTMNQVDSYTDNESLYGSTFAEPEAYMSSSGTAEGLSPGMVYQDYKAIQSSSHPVPLSFYEINLSTLSGGISQSALNSYTPSLGAGLMVADTMLLGLKQFGIVNQELFALPQYDFNRGDGKSVLLWGSVVDMGVTDRRRPQFLAVQLANQALMNGASMLQTIHSGADPTWNQSLINTVQLNGAHDLQSYSFVQGSNHSVVVFNFSRGDYLPVTFSGPNGPTGSVSMQQLTSANPTDTNENASVVNIASSTLNGFGSSSSLSLPPYSMTVLTWNGSTVAIATPGPSISAVSASALTASSATIAWTTDQPSSSQVLYGTSSAYGSTSAYSSTLTTGHSVTLSGLSSGTTYNYSAASTNSSGVSSNSPNFTFTTPTSGTPPQISYVSSWGLTQTGFTVTWSTNEPATTSLQYGTTSALGQSTPAQTSLSNNHGVTLTGLSSGTTYYFVAQSSDSSGIIGYSTVQTVTTASSTPIVGTSAPSAYSAPPPTLAYVESWDIVDTSATISWSTNEPSTTALAYGLTTALGAVTPTQSGLTVSHGVTLTGLTPGTTYSFVAQSADPNGNVGYSSTYSFTTGNSSNGTGSTPISPNASTPSPTPTTSNANAPQVSYIASWGLNGGGITISWSTDVLANTSLAYGTTSALGQTTAVQSALTNTHGVTLTGLNSATTYYFVAQSADANGNMGYSVPYTFTTLANSAPQISAVRRCSKQ